MSLLSDLPTSGLLRQLLLIALFFLLAWLVYRLSPRLARQIVSVSRLANSQRPLRPFP